MSIKTSIFLFLAVCSMAFAQSKPKIAVYVASGDLKDSEKKMLSTKVLVPFIKSERYIAIERSDAFLSNIARERQKQRDGSVDNSQISRLGKEAGIQFVCVADLVDAFGIYSLSARLVNVETAEIVGFGEAEMSSLGEIGDAANKIFEQISGIKSPNKPAAPKTIAPPVASQNPKEPEASLAAVSIEKQKMLYSWGNIKGRFPSNEAFFAAAQQAFETYLKKYRPRLELKDGRGRSLIMRAKHRGDDVRCTFFVDENSQFGVFIETQSKKKAGLLKNVISETEKLGNRLYGKP